MKTIRVTAQYEMFAAEAGSPAHGISNVVRLSDHAVSDWFDNVWGGYLMELDDENFDEECSKFTF